MNDASFRQHQVAMAVQSLRMGVDDLSSMAADINDYYQSELEILRYDLEQLLLKARYPILQRQPAA